jgi:hypothetical protein
MTVKKKWHNFWELSLRMGFNLIEGNLKNLKEWSKEDFGQNLDQLRQQIKVNLFPSEPLVTTKELAEDDRSISDILIKIMDTWRKDVETPEDELAATVAPTDTDFTLNDMGNQKVKSEIDANIYETRVHDSQEDNDIKETVIITPGDKMAEKTANIKQEEDPNKTVIMINADVKTTDRKEAAFQINDHLEETIRPSNYARDKEKRPPVKPVSDPKKTLVLTPDRPGKIDESDLPETRIISPLQSASEYKKDKSSQFQDIRSNGPSKTDIPQDKELKEADQKLEKPEKDELLEETIIIQPKKNGSVKTEDNQ